MNTTDLSRAKRDLEKAVDVVKGFARAIWKNSSAPQNLCPLDYFYANAANGAAFGKRVQQLRKNQLVTTTAEFDFAVEIAYANYTNVETLAKAEKARKSDKRAAVAAKRDLKAELNLQEGVSLKGVDVGQYKVILAGLEPVRAHVEQARHNALRAAYHDVRKQLDLHVGNALAAFPHPKYAGSVAYPEHFLSWFKQTEVGGNRHIFVSRPQSEIGEHISRQAAQFALAYVQGYACKLSVKTGEAIAKRNAAICSIPANRDYVAATGVTSCTVSSDNLWSDSLATITLDNGETQVWHTQIIWNRSCLGKVFNQYPTRQV